MMTAGTLGDAIWQFLAASVMSTARVISPGLAAAAAFIAGPASAADLPAPVPMKAAAPAVVSWTGCYLGAQAGAARSRSSWDYTNNNPYDSSGNEGPQSLAGVVFAQQRGVVGGQVGCNYQLSPRWVVGVEGSWLSNPLNKTIENPNPLGATFILREAVTTNVKSIASLTGRVGAVVAPDWLVYARGGFATGQIATSGAVSPSVTGFDWIDTKWHYGWTV